MGFMNFISKKKDDKKVAQPVDENYYNSDIPVVEPGALPVGNLNQDDSGSGLVPITPGDLDNTIPGDYESKFNFEPLMPTSNSVSNELIFDDEVKPTQVLTQEQKQLAENGYYVTGIATDNLNTYPQTVSPTQQQQYTINDNSSDSLYDDELPYEDDDKDVFNSRVDGSYSSVSNQSYEDNRVNEHKFFSTSVEDIDNYKKHLGADDRDKQKIIGDSSIFNIGRIDDNK